MPRQRTAQARSVMMAIGGCQYRRAYSSSASHEGATAGKRQING